MKKFYQAFEEKQSITGVHKITGYNWQQIANLRMELLQMILMKLF